MSPNLPSLISPFLNQLVVVRTVDRQVTVQGRLSHVENNFGGLGNLILEGERGAMVLRHDAVQAIALLRRFFAQESEEVRKEP